MLIWVMYVLLVTRCVFAVCRCTMGCLHLSLSLGLIEFVGFSLVWCVFCLGCLWVWYSLKACCLVFWVGRVVIMRRFP